MRKQRRIIGAYMTRAGVGAITADQMNSKGELRRAMEVVSVDAENRTVELAFSSEFEGKRWFGIEVLDHTPGAVRLDRIRDGGALLMDHDWSDQIGVIESVRIDADRKGRAVVRFGRGARAQEIFQDVQDGIRKHVSVGYRVHDAKLVETREDVDVYRITDWEPFEISLVSVPFDHGVGIGRSMEIPHGEPAGKPADNGKREDNEPAANPPTIQEKHMITQVLRAANGDLVRAEVDDSGAITKVLETLEKAGDAERSHAKRGTEAERKRVAELMDLGERFKAEDLARDFARDGKTPAEMQAALLERFNERQAKPLADQQRLADIGMTDQDVKRYSLFRAIRALAPGASRADIDAAAFEFECSRAAADKYDKEPKGILVPSDVLGRAFNAGGAANSPTGATSGTNVVATDLMAGSFIEMLRNRTTIMRLATTMAGLVGNVDIPKQTGGATGYWVGEGGDATEGTPVIGQIALSPKSVAAYTDITRRLMKQSTPDAEGIVRRDLVNALAQSIDLAGYYGTGANSQPLGLANYAGINTVTFAAANPTFAELVQMETEVEADNADIGQMGYVFNARMRGHAKTTAKFGSGTESTIWEPGGTVNGYRAEVTNQITTGDVFFGNFADLIIGMWGGLDLTVDPYSLSKSGGLRIVVFQDVDFVLRRAESVCLGRDA